MFFLRLHIVEEKGGNAMKSNFPEQSYLKTIDEKEILYKQTKGDVRRGKDEYR